MAEPPEGADEDMTAIGMCAADQLRAARETVGLSLKDVAEKTRVPLRHLAALEEGDYGSLPGMTYCAGFVRAFARAVDLDEAVLVSRMRADIEEMGGLGKNPHEFEEAVDPARIPPRWIALAAAIIALLLAAGYGLWRMQLTTPPTDEQVAVQAAKEQTLRAALPTPTPTAPSGPVVMTAADAVWMRIYQTDGTRLFEGMLGKGESYTVPTTARDPMILTGRPDALAITVGGQAVPPLGTAERTISDVPISAAALLARPAAPTQPDDGGNVSAPSSNASLPVTNAPVPKPRRAKPSAAPTSRPIVPAGDAGASNTATP